ncbi:CocE/NonD family hydrolase [Streptomyces sp. NPDC001889]
MRHRLRFPHDIGQEDLRIPVRDGTVLYARVWRPTGEEPVPALLEYSPERLTDATVPRDLRRHPWYAGHGYASVRVDARGHGNSGGVPAGPAAEGAPGGPPDLPDAVDVIEWLAARPWCTGRVGMFGLGAGGTLALRVAALAPEPLRAVVTVCSSDDPYDNGGCALGGALPAGGLHSRSAALLSSVCRPPDPVFAGPSWRERWLTRLEAVEPAAHTWLAHQLRDDFWERQTPAAGAVRAAVLAVGGWGDPRRDTVLRLVSGLPPDRVRGVLGPWPHGYPDQVRQGAGAGFLHETLRWWDHHLRGIGNEVMAEPLLRTRAPGGPWTGEAHWPPPDVTPLVYELRGAPRTVDSPHSTGADAGPFLPDLLPGADQRADDAHCACFEFPVADEPVTVLGRPRLALRLRLDVPHGQVIARLCDVAPDGSSAPVTLGALGLSARHGPERVHAWPPGTTEEVSLELLAADHTFRPGHRIRLAVSSAYWPWIWPQTGSAGFVLDPEGSRLELPVHEHPAGRRTLPDPFRVVGQDPGAAREQEGPWPVGVSSAPRLDGERPERLLIRDLTAGTWRLETLPCPAGTRTHPGGLEITEDALEVRTVQERDPHSARALTTWSTRLHRPELSWDITVETRSELSCDASDFLLRDEAVCRDGRETVFHRTWERRIPRLAG